MNANTWDGTNLTCASIVPPDSNCSYDSPPIASSTFASRWPKLNPSSKIEVSRITDTLESPAPFTSAIPFSDRISFVTASTSSGFTAATISRSPIVSLLLRAEPANSALSTQE